MKNLRPFIGNPRIGICLALGLLMSVGVANADTAPAVTAAQGQVTTLNGAKSDAILLKIRQIDMLNQLLPLGMKKSQYDPMLAAIEKCRANEKKIKGMEDDDLAKLDIDIDSAVTNALDKGIYPPHAMEVKAANLLNAMGVRRTFAINENVDTLYEAAKKTFDEGQMTVMEKSLDAEKMDPSVKKDSMDKPAKIKFFLRQIFLDPLTYDLLIKLQKNAS